MQLFKLLLSHINPVLHPAFQSARPAAHTHFLRRLPVWVLASALALCPEAPGLAVRAFAYDAGKISRHGLIRGDLSTWTQRGDSFPQNKLLSVDGDSPISSMGCSYYATFFMLCRMGIKNPLTDTAWQFAMECKRKKLSREGTGYFGPRSISKLTDGRVRFVEEGNDPNNYYEGQSAVQQCANQDEVTRLMRQMVEKKGWFLIACVVGDVTNYQNEEYYSEGHYIFIDSFLKDGDFLIGDSAFPGTRWSDNWGAHNARIVKLYAYRLLDENGKQIRPSERQSMYIVRSWDED